MSSVKEMVQFLIGKKIVVPVKLISALAKKEKTDIGIIYSELQEKSDEEIKKIIESICQDKGAEQENNGTVSIVVNHTVKEVNKTVQDFVSYFNNRYKTIEKMLRNRQELSGVTAIKRIAQKDEREQVAVIGIVKKSEETKNGNLIFTLEDATGEIKILISKEKKELFGSAKSVVLDEVIGVVGVSGKGIIFGEKIIWPDIPVYNELKKSPVEEYALFLSDIHVGSKQFLAASFDKFIKWINGELGDEKQKEIVKKVKYIFIVGDVVDGVGIYPGQEYDLEILDIYEQYKICAALLDKIPKHMKIIISPGNHDAMRLAEPQLPFYEDIAKPLYDLTNAIIVSNPSIVNVGKTEGFPGINVLMYHGYSFDYYIANVDEIRNNGGYDRADLVMRFLLQRRHLAPTHASCLYVPFADDDPMVIGKIPDIFATGHLHKTSVSSYRNITLICGSCWQAKTAFQEKMGHNPEPARVPLVNLQTREVKILRFGDE
jgi:DNA polymerase II small subunit